MFGIVEATKESRVSNDGVMRSDSDKEVTVQVAASAIPQDLTSQPPNSAFNQLKVFSIKSRTGAFLSLNVLGWYRVPKVADATLSIVTLITQAGFIIIEGTDLTFEVTMGHVFSAAGFDVIKGRKLLGTFDLVGLFNSVDWMYAYGVSAFDLMM